MPGELILLIVFSMIFILLLIGVPIAFSIFSGSILGLWMVGGIDTVVGFIGYSVHHLMASYTLAVAPMFILIGTLGEVCGLGELSFAAFYRFLGSLRGGLLMATTGAAALFGACCGSSVASAALFSRLALPELKKLGYQREISLGAIATAGGLATLIPPSIMVVFYGILTNTSIGKVLLAGIVPGAVLSILIMAAIYLRIRINPSLAPRLSQGFSWRNKFASLLKIWPLIAVFGVIIGGIYTGFCTPTEAGAIGASVVFVYSLIVKTSLRKIVQAFHEATALTSQIFVLIIGGQMLSKVVSLSGVSHAILSWLVAANLSLFFVWIIFIALFLVLGAILDPISMMVLTLPIIFPVMAKLGVDPIALGVIVVLLVEVAVITPPIGFNVYVVAAIAGVDPAVAFRGSVLFFFVILLMILIIIVFPGLATFLPQLAFS